MAKKQVTLRCFEIESFSKELTKSNQMLIILYSLAYFLFNFEALYKTKNKIDDQIRKEKEYE